jgi:deoxyribodipyrimidine photo-lyase
MEKINVVWFKRDLRTNDHLPLKLALESGLPVMLVYCFEPSLVASSKYDVRHWRFIYQSLQDLNRKLAAFKMEVIIHYGEIPGFFNLINSIVQISTVFSHIETGISITYERDKVIQKLFHDQKINWIEIPQNGVRRGRKNRNKWAEQWKEFMTSPIDTPDFTRGKFHLIQDNFKLKGKKIPDEWKLKKPLMQERGRGHCLEVFEFFFYGQGEKLQSSYQQA